MNKIKIIIILFLSFFISSCTGDYRRGNEFTKLMYEEKSSLIAGNISKNYIISRYNNPNHKWKDRSGNDVYNYQHIVVKPFASSYIPLVSIFINPSAKINIYDVSLTFNKGGKMIQNSFFSNEREY